MEYKNKKYYNDKKRLMSVKDVYPSIENLSIDKYAKNLVIYLTMEKDGNVHVEKKDMGIIDKGQNCNLKSCSSNIFIF